MTTNRCRECSACKQVRRIHGRGLCDPCYKAFRRANPDFERTPRKHTPGQQCQAPDCQTPARPHRAYCSVHHNRLRRLGSFEAKQPKGLSLRERFERFVPRGLPDDVCWEWLGGHREGYGAVREMSAHRASYLLNRGPIPPGMLVRHRCDNPPCVNPHHLEIGTPSDNTADMLERGRWRSRRLSDETRQWAVDAIANGMTRTAAAAAVGIHPGICPSSCTEGGGPMSKGPRCTRCGATEQECAWSHPCCTADRGCSHFGFLDANGNEKPHGNQKKQEKAA